jgi:hypothetical protein
MAPQKLLVAILLILALAACIPPPVRPGAAVYAPTSHNNGADTRTDGDGGAGGGGM